MANESGRAEVYVRSYPEGTHKRQVSFDGGVQPRWRGDGRELFYRHGNEVMSTSLTTAGAEPRFSVPRVLFKGDYLAYWDVLPDGQRFVFVKDFAQPRTAVTLVQNWFAELTK